MLQSASALDRHVSTLTRRVIPLALIVLSMFAVVRKAAGPVNNADTYFHLRFGHEFLHGWTPWSPGHVVSSLPALSLVVAGLTGAAPASMAPFSS